MRLSPARASILVLLSALWILQPVDVASQAQQAADRARGHSARHLDDLAAKHGNGVTGHRELRLQIDERRKAHRKVQQLYRGVPVFGGEAIVHTADDGTLEGVTDNYVTAIGPVNTVPVLTPQEAIDAALAAYGVDASVLTAAPRTDLWILRQDGDHLAYRVRLRREDGTHDTAMPVYFIDAADGSVLFGYDNLQSQSSTGTGTSLYSGTVSIATYQKDGTYYLQDVDRKLGTLSANNGTSLPGVAVTDGDNAFDAAAQKAAVDAHYAATKVYDYYLATHGRYGISDNPAIGGGLLSADGVTRLLPSVVHYSNNYCNAFWNSQYMVYGDGNASQGCFPLVSLDTGGHEMTHGVVEATAGLIYSGESGALNESFADIFAAMTERYVRGMSANVWLIGEEVLPPFLRSMANPHADGISPDYYFAGIGNIDVHWSSGVGNKAFYLLSEGGTHHSVTVTGIGPDKAEKIFYKALTTYMVSSTNYAGARTATLSATADLYGNGSDEYDAVATAWCAVGVGACPVADATAPITTASAAGYVFGSWTNQGVTVTLDAADNANGSGVASLVYSASGATTLPATTTGGNAVIPVNAEGETFITFHATDVAGNIEAQQTVVVRIDRTAPSVIASAGGYVFGRLTNLSVNVSLFAADNAGGSGLASIVYSLSGATTLPPTTAGGEVALTVSADGETIITFQATDVAGNTTPPQTRVVRIDRAGPSATANASPATLWPPNGKPVAVTISGVLEDPAGVASASYIVDDEYGQASSSGAVAIAADGSYRFTIQLPASRLGADTDGRVFRIRIVVTDAAGNTGRVETRVVVPHSQGK